MFVYGRYATGLPIRNYGKTSTLLSWTWRVSLWTGSLGRFLFNQNSGFPWKVSTNSGNCSIFEMRAVFTRTENSVNSRSKVEWHWKLPDSPEVVLFIGNYPWKMFFHRLLEAAENSDRTFGGWLWRLPSNEWSKFVVKTFSTIDSISTSWNTIVRLELAIFFGFLIVILFEPQAGIL